MNVVVLGMGKSGMSAAMLLHRHDFSVFVSEINHKNRVRKAAEKLAQKNIRFETGKHSPDKILGADFIVVSPGITDSVPVIQVAEKKKIPIYSEIEVASWFCKAPIIGITGSNGKTTTTSLIGEILKTKYPNAFIGGNIGIPFSDEADRLSSENFAILELSSFQLERIQTFHPHIVVLLNFTPDHLDRHHFFRAYVDAKCRIFSNQTKDDYIVYNADDAAVASSVLRASSQFVSFGKNACGKNNVFYDRERIFYQSENFIEVVKLNQLNLVGEHNYSNVSAAVAVALCVNVPIENIRKSIVQFQPVEHRIEFVGTLDGVKYYNDSKATNSDATAKALQSFSQPVILLAGGHAKEKDYSHLKSIIEQRVKKIILFGESREQLYRDLKFDGGNAATKVADLKSAFVEARKAAEQGDVILLSPTCASTDQYRNFEERGTHFKKLFAELAEIKRSKVAS